MELTWSAYFKLTERKAAQKYCPAICTAHVLCDGLCVPNLEVCCLLPCLEVVSTTVKCPYIVIDVSSYISDMQITRI